MIPGAYYYAGDSNYMKGHYLGLTDHRYTIENKTKHGESVNYIIPELSKSYVKWPIFLAHCGLYESFGNVEYTIDPLVKCLPDIKVKLHQGIISEGLKTSSKQPEPFNLKPVGPIVRIWPYESLIPLKQYKFRMDQCTNMFFGIRRHSHRELLIIHDEPVLFMHRRYTHIELIDTDTVSIRSINKTAIGRIPDTIYSMATQYLEFDWFVGNQPSTFPRFIGTDAQNNPAYITYNY